MRVRSIAIYTLATLAAAELSHKVDAWSFDLERSSANSPARIVFSVNGTPAAEWGESEKKIQNLSRLSPHSVPVTHLTSQELGFSCFKNLPAQHWQQSFGDMTETGSSQQTSASRLRKSDTVSVEKPCVGASFSSAQLLKPPALNNRLPSLLEVPVSQVSSLPALAERPSLAQGGNLEEPEKLVRDVKIRFVGKDGATVDESGNPIVGRTQQAFILSELQLKPGEVFREEVLEEDLRRLRRLDLFREIKVSRYEDAAGVEIIYELQEGRYRSLTPSLGNDEDIGNYATLSYQDRNIGGINQKFRVRVQASTRDFQYSGRFINPYRAGTPNRLGYRIEGFRQRGFSDTFNEGIELPNGNSIREGRFGGSVALLKSFEEWDGALGLNYTRISIRDRDWNVSPTDEFGTPLTLSGTGIDDLFTLSLGLTRDRRNRASNATAGSLLTLSVEQSLPIGLGNILLNRVQANYIQYVPMQLLSAGAPADFPVELTEVLAFNFQAGTAIGELPPYEAFNLGGLNSVRGYEPGDIGSGRSFVQGTVEYRFPIIAPVGGVLFADFASDLGSGDTVLGEPAPLRGKPGSGFGYGFGLRVKSPVGLIRVDMAINESGDVRFELTTGQRF